LNTLKFDYILRCDVTEKKVAIVKPTSDECCNNDFGDRKRNIATNKAKVRNMIEAAATCQRNMFSEIKIAIKCNTNITYTV